jgi:hypothetical protein
LLVFRKRLSYWGIRRFRWSRRRTRTPSFQTSRGCLRYTSRQGDFENLSLSHRTLNRIFFGALSPHRHKIIDPLLPRPCHHLLFTPELNSLPVTCFLFFEDGNKNVYLIFKITYRSTDEKSRIFDAINKRNSVVDSVESNIDQVTFVYNLRHILLADTLLVKLIVIRLNYKKHRR